MKQVIKLIKNTLLSPEAEVSKGNLIQNLAYGRKESVISAMSKSKMIDVLFSLTSCANDRKIFKASSSDVEVIFEDLFCVIASLFDSVDPSHLVKSKTISSSGLEAQASIKKPIRHGRFSGSVSVQLSVRLIFNNIIYIVRLVRILF